MSPQRLATERAILARHCPAFTLANDGLCASGSFTTNAGKVYQIRVELEGYYPDQMPRVWVVSPRLAMRDGVDLSNFGASARMHTLGGHNGWVQVCHSRGEKWSPQDTVYKVLIKARLWLEAYEGHLATGNPLDFYLRHQ